MIITYSLSVDYIYVESNIDAKVFNLENATVQDYTVEGVLP